MIYFPRRSPQLLNFTQAASTHNTVINGGALTFNALRPRGPGPSELLVNNAGMMRFTLVPCGTVLHPQDSQRDCSRNAEAGHEETNF